MTRLTYNIILVSFFAILSSTKAFAESEPVSVGISKLSNILINPKSSVPANVVSLNHTIVSSEVTGRALTIPIQIGDYIKKGELLTTIDCRSYALANKQAEAGLKVAKTQLNYSQKQFNRQQSLLKTGIIAKENFERAESNKLIALADIQLKKASINTAKLAISRCQVYAPFSGQITQKLVQQGQLLIAGTPLFKIIQTNTNEIKVNLSPDNIEKLDHSSSLEFVIGNKHIKAIVRSIILIADEATRTQEVRLALPENSNLSTGLSGRVEWYDKQQFLPAEYLIRRNSILGIMIAEDIVEGIGHATFHQIIGAKEGQAVEIDLPEDTIVITQNRYQVKSGQSIKVR